MKNNNVQKLIIAIVTVVLIIAIVGGSTFAYFQWTTAENQKTSVNITIQQEQITMHIEPEQTTFTGLKPETSEEKCVHSQAVITVVNNTGTLALPSFKLSAKVTKGGNGTLTSEILSNIEYLIYNGEHDELNPCGLGSPEYVEINNDPDDLFTNDPSDFYVNNDNIYAEGTFKNVSLSGIWTDIPVGADKYLPRQYNKNTSETSGITFKALPYATTTRTYTVYLWINHSYTPTNIGNVISDPLQDATIELTWSTNSKIEQVSQ